MVTPVDVYKSIRALQTEGAASQRTAHSSNEIMCFFIVI